MQWLLLVLAIASEVGATLSLKIATDGRPRWYLGVVPGYLAAFALLSAALGEGLALGVAYGIWAATGVAATAVLSRILFKEPLTPVMGAGIVLIIGGVLLIEVGATH